MKVEEVLQRQGSARDLEDGLVICPPHTLGVFDGYSFYHPVQGPPRIDGLTQGMLATRYAVSTFADSRPEEELPAVLGKANDRIWRRARAAGLSLEELEHLPGAAFAVCKEIGERVDLVTASDAGAVWQNRDGTFGGTKNQAFAYEKEVERCYAAFMTEAGGDRNAVWTRWLPIRAQMIRKFQNRHIEGGFAALTGQAEGEELFQKVDLMRDELRLIILYTDGCVSHEDTEDPVALAQKLIGLYEKGGLVAVYKEAMEAAAKKRNVSHVDSPEASAIVASF